MLTFATPFFYIGLGSGIRDPGSGMNKYSDPGSGIKHPGSATLHRGVIILVQERVYCILIHNESLEKHQENPWGRCSWIHRPQ
jgi:hypothetical protein